VSGVRPLGKKTSSSTVWKHCRVLKDPNTLSTEAGAFFTAEAEKHGWVLDGKHKHTHVCLECGAGVKLTLNPPGASDPKNSPGQVYNSTQMANHIKNLHENLQHAKAAWWVRRSDRRQSRHTVGACCRQDQPDDWHVPHRDQETVVRGSKSLHGQVVGVQQPAHQPQHSP